MDRTAKGIWAVVVIYLSATDGIIHLSQIRIEE
jgi:hypothetical protein